MIWGTERCEGTVDADGSEARARPSRLMPAHKQTLIRAQPGQTPAPPPLAPLFQSPSRHAGPLPQDKDRLRRLPGKGLARPLPCMPGGAWQEYPGP